METRPYPKTQPTLLKRRIKEKSSNNQRSLLWLVFLADENLRPPLSQVSESTKHDESRIHRKLAPSQRRKTLESKSWWFRPDQPGIAASGFTVVVTEEEVNSEQKEVLAQVPPKKARVSLLRMEIILMILGQLSLADVSINAYIIHYSTIQRSQRKNMVFFWVCHNPLKQP